MTIISLTVLSSLCDGAVQEWAQGTSLGLLHAFPVRCESLPAWQGSRQKVGRYLRQPCAKCRCVKTDIDCAQSVGRELSKHTSALNEVISLHVESKAAQLMSDPWCTTLRLTRPSTENHWRVQSSGLWPTLCQASRRMPGTPLA